MTFEEFEACARAMWEEIPASAREGVETIDVQPEALQHPDFDWVYTMGECVTENWPSGFGGEGDMRSELVLHHGSFVALQEEDPAFDWEGELWETILHELLHHREAAAGESGLDEYDWAEEQNFRRLAGEPFDPDFFRAVPSGSDGVVRLESELFIEVIVPERVVDVPFEWRGKGYSIRVPPISGRAFVDVRNLAGGRLCIVVRRRRPWWRFGRGVADASGFMELERSALPLPAGGM